MCVSLTTIPQPITKSIKQIAAGEAWEAQPPSNTPYTEYSLQKWFLSNLEQREAMLESKTPFALIGVNKSGKVIVLNAPTVQSTAAPEQRQVLGYLGQDFLSEEALA